jgi:hypothetical protein
VLKRNVVVLIFAGAIASCSHPTAPRGEFLSADATVSRSVECLSLTIAGAQYQPVGLPDSLAIVGLRLHVAGQLVRDGASTCMIPILYLTSVSRA